MFTLLARVRGGREGEEGAGEPIEQFTEHDTDQLGAPMIFSWVCTSHVRSFPMPS